MSLYITHPPCPDCAKHVAADGITRLIHGTSEDIRARFDITKSLQILKDCDVEVVEIET